jgi:DNA-binding HxlR family transcriptional regulator
MRTYGQYCPIARTSELFAERWTPIIVRNLFNGCRTFTEIRQGAPGIPSALLAARLASLTQAGIVEREPVPGGRGWHYRLTEMGSDLHEVCDAMGRWGSRWLEIEPQHIDAAYVLWATAKLVDVDLLPDRTVVVRVVLADTADGYWLVLRRPAAELCTRGSGYVEDLVLRTDSATLVDLHLRRAGYRAAIRDGRLAVEGPRRLADQFLTWIRPSPYAGLRRQ